MFTVLNTKRVNKTDVRDYYVRCKLFAWFKIRTTWGVQLHLFTEHGTNERWVITITVVQHLDNRAKIMRNRSKKPSTSQNCGFRSYCICYTEDYEGAEELYSCGWRGQSNGGAKAPLTRQDQTRIYYILAAE